MTVPGQFDEKDRATLSDELTHIKKVWWVFSDWVIALGFVVAVGSLFYFLSFAVRVVGTLASIYCATQVAYRLGVLASAGSAASRTRARYMRCLT